MTKDKKWHIIWLVYGIYAIFIGLYLFRWAPTGIPDIYLGTVLDPATFLPDESITTSVHFARIRHFIFFLQTPFQWLIMSHFIWGGLSDNVQAVITKRVSKKFFATSLYFLVFSLYTFLIMLPIRFISLLIARHFGTSHITIGRWLTNRGIDFIIDFVLYMVIIHVVLWLIKKFPKRWWLVAWGSFVPFAFFFMLIQPLVIDPLYNDFIPLTHERLEQDILNMAENAGVRAERVFVVEMSTRTSTINGYVTGVGPSARIVLWDTALQQLSDDAIMFLMAHEIAHYVYRDIYFAIGVATIFAFGGLFVLSMILNKQEKGNFAQIPIAILSIYVMLFITSPVTNAISRRVESRADTFALELTGDSEGGIELFQTLARTSLNETTPPPLVRFFRSTHPSIFERIHYLKEE